MVDLHLYVVLSFIVDASKFKAAICQELYSSLTSASLLWRLSWPKTDTTFLFETLLDSDRDLPLPVGYYYYILIFPEPLFAP